MIPHRSPSLVLAALLSAGLASACERTIVSVPSSTVLQESAAPLVEIHVVHLENLERTLSLPGSVRALESAEIQAKLGGYLQEITVEIGQEVECDELIARLAVPELAAELSRAEAELALTRVEAEQTRARLLGARAAVNSAQAELGRAREARRGREAEVGLRRSELARWEELAEGVPSIERGKVDEARFRLEAAEAALGLVDAERRVAEAGVEGAHAAFAAAQADVEAANAREPVAQAELELQRELGRYAEVRAPFAGVVVERHVDPGVFVRSAATNSSAMPLVTLARLERVRVSVDVPMDAVAALDVGDPAVLDRVQAAPGRRFEGSVTRVARALGERSRMMRAEIELANPADDAGRRALGPGYYGRVTIVLESLRGTPTVPASAIFAHEGRRAVFVVEDGLLRLRPIEVVWEDGAKVGVGEGLRAGDALVLTGAAGLRDGQAVRTSFADEVGR